MEADAPSMEPYDLCQLLRALVALSKKGVCIPAATVGILANCVGTRAPHWDLQDAAVVLSCILQLLTYDKRPGHRGSASGEAAQEAARDSIREATAAAGLMVADAVGERLAAMQTKTGAVSSVC